MKPQLTMGLGIDYFDWDGKKYLLIADYFCHFLILRMLHNMSATILVTTLRSTIG